MKQLFLSKFSGGMMDKKAPVIWVVTGVIIITITTVVGIGIAFMASFIYINYMPETSAVTVHEGIYTIPKGYYLWKVDGEICHIAGILHGRLTGTILTTFTSLIFIPTDNSTIVCDYTISSKDPILLVPHKTGSYYVIKPSTIYIAYNKPDREGWFWIGLWGGVLMGFIITIITLLPEEVLKR